MKRAPKISEAEWEVMKILWKGSPRTVNEIVEELIGKIHWKRETIRTLINRLVAKKALKFEKKGREHHYSPSVSRDECVKAETASFVSRFGPGAIEPMLVAFVEEKKLSAEKIARLKKILDENQPIKKYKQ